MNCDVSPLAYATSDYRRAALLAPLVIAVPFCVETGIDGGLTAPTGILMRSMAVYVAAALVVGYAYIAVVELVATVIRRRASR